MSRAGFLKRTTLFICSLTFPAKIFGGSVRTWHVGVAAPLFPVDRKVWITQGGLGPAKWERADRGQGRRLSDPAVFQATCASCCREV